MESAIAISRTSPHRLEPLSTGSTTSNASTRPWTIVHRSSSKRKWPSERKKKETKKKVSRGLWKLPELWKNKQRFLHSSLNLVKRRFTVTTGPTTLDQNNITIGDCSCLTDGVQSRRSAIPNLKSEGPTNPSGFPSPPVSTIVDSVPARARSCTAHCCPA